MDFTKSDLVSLYCKKRTAELLEIIKNKHGYTDIALEVIKEEISLRGLQQSDIDEYYSNHIVKEDLKLKRANFIELTFFEKFLIYFGLPILFLGMLLILGAKNIWKKKAFS